MNSKNLRMIRNRDVPRVWSKRSNQEGTASFVETDHGNRGRPQNHQKWEGIRKMIYGLITAITVVLIRQVMNWRYGPYREITGYSILRILLDRGTHGEYRIYSAMKQINGDAIILPNLYLPKSNGETTEIDLVMVTESGLYVVESKNFRGWIFGSEQQRFWTQTLPGGRKEKFFNPIWQNQGHIQALKQILEFSDERCCHSYVVFGGGATLKKIILTGHQRVMTLYQLKRTLLKDLRDHPVCFSEDQLAEIVRTLSSYQKVSEEIRRQHIEAIRRKSRK